MMGMGVGMGMGTSMGMGMGMGGGAVSDGERNGARERAYETVDRSS